MVGVLAPDILGRYVENRESPPWDEWQVACEVSRNQTPTQINHMTDLM
jgi:hypothetical protein